MSGAEATVNITNLRQFATLSLREQVTRALRAAIVSGELAPGEVYSAPALGERFGVSATPVREAMLDLVRENLVTTVPNKGYRVTEVGEAELDDITELRMLIEPVLTAQAALAIPDEDFPELRALADAIVENAAAGDLVAYTEADRAFHLRILGYAGNERAVAVISELRANTRLFGLAGLAESGQLTESAREHYAIVDALAAHDPAAVEVLLREHISQTRGRWATS
ncbi:MULTISPECIES: GntR family transcriptional regulator [unclassified Gordonia (in: high G+C Gram-positive bacteria)]|uniref:GntR family transcriptional regulator n=1 Tax=unclassified Gordonia (in: high G+C Gram-positive bacteria) TaxID=2657482 RepID=UPI001FFE826F|nr:MULTISPECIES: GntR family transcriptional regulator [unclassified Gordonia (in: high G+C Gram-positive bacteria)]UQE73932.1 GntR family transcriptional regulator [Gordonia sp. PP30]